MDRLTTIDTALEFVRTDLPGWWIGAMSQMNDGSATWQVWLTDTPWSAGGHRAYSDGSPLPALREAIQKALAEPGAAKPDLAAQFR